MVEADRQAREAAKATVEARESEATSVVQAIEATATARTGLPLVLFDEFNTNENKWHTGLVEASYVTLRRSIQGGVYRWRADVKEGFAQMDRVNVDPVEDFYLAVTLRHVSGSARSSAGLIFRVDYNGYYDFAIDTSENYSFWLNEDGDWTPIIDWTHTNAIVPDGDNRLEVGAEGGQFAFFINGQLVAQVEETTRTSGAVGLEMDAFEPGDAVIYEFDDFELRAPAPASP